jgi:hypothetical protein
MVRCRSRRGNLRMAVLGIKAQSVLSMALWVKRLLFEA